MIQVSQPLGTQTAPALSLTPERKNPKCCGQEMQLLLRRALLHSDGTVDYQAAWGCRICGRRIL
jgi:hypothetical protein